MLVLDEEVGTTSAFNFGNDEIKGIAGVKIVDLRVEVFVSAVGFFDFECV